VSWHDVIIIIIIIIATAVTGDYPGVPRLMGRAEVALTVRNAKTGTA
jgi:hypothetical protein